jgi:hypothetical protein
VQREPVKPALPPVAAGVLAHERRDDIGRRQTFFQQLDALDRRHQVLPGKRMLEADDAHARLAVERADVEDARRDRDAHVSRGRVVSQNRVRVDVIVATEHRLRREGHGQRQDADDDGPAHAAQCRPHNVVSSVRHV